MSDAPYQGLHWVGAEQLRRGWGWFLALGIILIILGLVCLGNAVMATLFWEVVLAYTLIAGGALSLIHAFWRRRWAGFFMELFTGILYLALGILILLRPVQAGISMTLVIALALLIGGGFRIAVSLTMPLHNWIWVFFSGIITLALGVMILKQWPLSGEWVIGLFVGVEMVFYGWSLVVLGFLARSLPDPEAQAPWWGAGTPNVPASGTQEGIVRPPSAPPGGP
jgi:uncharacterized membrane protein HdeD (DUF308 family)